MYLHLRMLKMCTLECQWATYDSGISEHSVMVDVLETQEDMQGEQFNGGWMDVDTEEDNDHESLDPEEMKKSSIYCFVQKLSRYYIACSIITLKLIALVHSGAGINIKVETVPISITTSMPAKENKYPSLESFLEQHMLNPLLRSIQGFIGMSTKCCWCCDFVLKHLQLFSMDGRYANDTVGPLLLFSVGGTHSCKYTTWVFPNHLTHIKHYFLNFNKISLNKRLRGCLMDKVNIIMGQLQNLEYEADSSVSHCLLPSTANYLTIIKQEEILRAWLIIFILSDVRALVTLAGYDSKVILRTNFYKTLIMVLSHLLQQEHVSIVVSPLKRLQVTQKTCKESKIFITAPEQLMPHQGHLTCFGKAVYKKRAFNKTIKHISIDEAHVISPVARHLPNLKNAMLTNSGKLANPSNQSSWYLLAMLFTASNHGLGGWRLFRSGQRCEVEMLEWVPPIGGLDSVGFWMIIICKFCYLLDGTPIGRVRK
ncbi:hypothetical protein PILCRDRAFT_87305 [Piloderma croceum F 1598]|uniref:Uncharacterized protein n=1 Tax=Piloderma croceum (strain F 1598) TaxID=765440 RepID=A0A0C3C5P7_PILCF|nr:hypothetical protein PILCRDRAFT_87305 [Piloderma croceum F 1598]